ncbi:hypothetical protein WMY93_032483 [Mugilogobius chulae]|uniref:ADF-H domain-containing protein n=1 Tax=Mugilogobius chulae TaxID=88201 RepID=A0AAW0MRT8_9GOBI
MKVCLPCLSLSQASCLSRPSGFMSPVSHVSHRVSLVPLASCLLSLLSLKPHLSCLCPQASGVTVNDEVIKVFNEMKVHGSCFHVSCLTSPVSCVSCLLCLMSPVSHVSPVSVPQASGVTVNDEVIKVFNQMKASCLSSLWLHVSCLTSPVSHVSCLFCPQASGVTVNDEVIKVFNQMKAHVSCLSHVSHVSLVPQATCLLSLLSLMSLVSRPPGFRRDRERRGDQSVYQMKVHVSPVSLSLRPHVSLSLWLHVSCLMSLVSHVSHHVSLVSVPQASGVTVNDEVIKVFNEMKVRKASTPDEVKKRKKAVLFCLSEDSRKIIVEEGKQILVGDIGDTVDDPYACFVKMLPPKDCRYCLYDATYETRESKKEDLVFVFCHSVSERHTGPGLCLLVSLRTWSLSSGESEDLVFVSGESEDLVLSSGESEDLVFVFW